VIEYTLELRQSLLTLWKKESVITIRAKGFNYVDIIKNISSEYVMLTVPFPFEVICFRFDTIDSILEHGRSVNVNKN
jgi:hypothetical protein